MKSIILDFEGEKVEHDALLSDIPSIHSLIKNLSLKVIFTKL